MNRFNVALKLGWEFYDTSGIVAFTRNRKYAAFKQHFTTRQKIANAVAAAHNSSNPGDFIAASLGWAGLDTTSLSAVRISATPRGGLIVTFSCSGKWIREDGRRRTVRTQAAGSAKELQRVLEIITSDMFTSGTSLNAQWRADQERASGWAGPLADSRMPQLGSFGITQIAVTDSLAPRTPIRSRTRHLVNPANLQNEKIAFFNSANRKHPEDLRLINKLKSVGYALKSMTGVYTQCHGDDVKKSDFTVYSVLVKYLLAQGAPLCKQQEACLPHTLRDILQNPRRAGNPIVLVSYDANAMPASVLVFSHDHTDSVQLRILAFCAGGTRAVMSAELLEDVCNLADALTLSVEAETVYPNAVRAYRNLKFHFTTTPKPTTACQTMQRRIKTTPPKPLAVCGRRVLFVDSVFANSKNEWENRLLRTFERAGYGIEVYPKNIFSQVLTRHGGEADPSKSNFQRLYDFVDAHPHFCIEADRDNLKEMGMDTNYLLKTMKEKVPYFPNGSIEKPGLGKKVLCHGMILACYRADGKPLSLLGFNHKFPGSQLELEAVCANRTLSPTQSSRGTGSILISDICAVADDMEVPIHLLALPEPVPVYEKKGFVKDVDGYDDVNQLQSMTRKPRTLRML